MESARQEMHIPQEEPNNPSDKPGDNLAGETRKIPASEEITSLSRANVDRDDAQGTISDEKETDVPNRLDSSSHPTSTSEKPSGSTEIVQSSLHDQTTTPPNPRLQPQNALPRRVDQVDAGGTEITPSAYRPGISSIHPPPRKRVRMEYPQQSENPLTQTEPKPDRARKKKPGNRGNAALGCVVRLTIGLLFLIVAAIILTGTFIIYQYYSIRATLPNITELKQKASRFETTRILDRSGNTLYEILDPTAGRRTYVPLNKISPYLLAATIAVEDKEYYNHPGFDPVAIARALFLNYLGESSSGASTITQQLARTLLMTPEERSQRTVQRKAREIVMAAEITRVFSKEDILELYLNEINYGSMAYGIEAAAESYFYTTADKLSLGQSVFLAGLPQAPSVYDIYTNREETLRRFRTALVLAYETSEEKNCIMVSTIIRSVCVDPTAATEALREIENTKFQQKGFAMRFPHWVNYVRSQLEERFDAQTIYRSGFLVYTTIDPQLQEQAETIMKQKVTELTNKNAKNGALVAIRPNTGEILAMVGSPDFYSKTNSGQVNMAISPRQPGSAIKPLTYAAAFERGWTPSTLIWDVPSDFPPSGDPNDTRPPYKPANYDGRFHGPVTVRSALANSYNVPAVKALDFVGIYRNPKKPNEDGLIGFANRLGVTSLTRQDYGLSLTLGGGDVTLLDLSGAFGVFANGGRRVPLVSITKIVDYQGKTVYEHKPSAGEQTLRSEHAYLITSILSDNNARTPMFGATSVLNVPFPAAVKTGTTNDFRDNWTVGYTPDLVVGVWVGNADYSPMVNTTGLTGAAPIWSQFIKAAVQTLSGGRSSNFSRPAGVVDRVICSISGTEPSELCPSQRSEVFANDQLPLGKENDLWQRVSVDSWTGLKASSVCGEFRQDKTALNISDKWAKNWLVGTADGMAWAKANGVKGDIFLVPDRECRETDPRASLQFTNLSEGQTIQTSPLDIYAIANATQNFKEFRLEFGLGDNPVDWKPLVENVTTPLRQSDKIITWDLKDIPPGKFTLRITMYSKEGNFVEKRIHLNMQVPTPTPTVTPTVTPTPTPSPSPTSKPTATPTLIPTGMVTPPSP